MSFWRICAKQLQVINASKLFNELSNLLGGFLDTDKCSYYLNNHIMTLGRGKINGPLTTN